MKSDETVNFFTRSESDRHGVPTSFLRLIVLHIHNFIV